MRDDRIGEHLATFEGESLDSSAFTVIELRLATEHDGQELLLRYEAGRLVGARPATRCIDCANIVTSRGGGNSCHRCINGS